MSNRLGLLLAFAGLFVVGCGSGQEYNESPPVQVEAPSPPVTKKASKPKPLPTPKKTGIPLAP